MTRKRTNLRESLVPIRLYSCYSWLLLAGLSVNSSGLRFGYELRRARPVGKGPAAQVSQLQNLFHLGEIDAVNGVGRLVVIGVKACEPPHRRDFVQRKRKLITALKNVERRVAVPFVVEFQTNLCVLAFNYGAVIGTVNCADQVQFVRGVGGDFDQTV